jgi:hypothetical protein
VSLEIRNEPKKAEKVEVVGKDCRVNVEDIQGSDSGQAIRPFALAAFQSCRS